MDKIAIISDIHGNLEALKVVLKDIKERNIEKIFCLGDIVAKGTHQEECVNLVRENCDVILKGNCDAYFTSEVERETKPEIELKRIDWINSKLSDESKNFLKSLPYSFEFYLSGRLVRLFHATPNKINKWYEDTKLMSDENTDKYHKSLKFVGLDYNYGDKE